jgi:hypothetical protein
MKKRLTLARVAAAVVIAVRAVVFGQEISTTSDGVLEGSKKILPGADRMQCGMRKKKFASRKCLYLIGLACV